MLNPTFTFANSTMPQLLVDPDLLTFFEGQTGLPLAKKFQVSNTGSGTLTIDSVTLAAENGTTDYALTLPNGEVRRYLEDGDEVIFRGHCHRAGAITIGMGECRGQVLPAR